jgi:uncharacterized protein YdeI (YjbR/CyaY-like superfamily)
VTQRRIDAPASAFPALRAGFLAAAIALLAGGVTTIPAFAQAGNAADAKAQDNASLLADFIHYTRIQNYDLAEAMAYAEEGRLPPKNDEAIELPEELIDALEADIEQAEAFARLTPGRQRSYVIHLGTTKNPATRVARIVKLRGHILAGKGAQER